VKRLAPLIVLVLTTAVGIVVADASSPNAAASSTRAAAGCTGAVDWSRASRAIGRRATIRGPVAGARYVNWTSGSPTFVNLGRDYPSARRVQVVIWGRNRGRFGVPERRYRGHTVCVRGYVDEYHGIPEIEVSTPSQITIAR
jgi:hypothetical protein